MKKHYLFLILLVSIFSLTKAQFNYPPTLGQNVPGNYVDLGTSGSVISTANFDDANSAAIPIGFNFSFNGANRTHFILNTNGFIKLGNNASMSAPSAAGLFYAAANNYTGGIFNSTNTLDVNLVSAFNHDLTAAASGAEYRTITSGTAGSRVCTIQFKNLRDKTSSPAEQYDSLNFQIKLYETTNIIEIQYGPYYSSTNGSAFKSSACGLKGSSTTDITAVSKGSTVDWNLAFFISGNYTGNAFNFGNDVNPGARPMPDPGRTLRFTPAFPNDLSVLTIHSMGSLPVPYAIPHTITAPVANLGTNNASAIKVYIDVTGANTYKDTVNIATLASGISFNRNFNGFSPDNLGINNIKIYVDADDNPQNDTAYLRQEVTNNIYSYAETTIPVNPGGVGYDTNTGLILNKYKINGSRYITGVEIFLNGDVVGQSLYGVLMDVSGAIATQSQTIVCTSADSLQYRYFEFDQPTLVTNSDFYVGLAQLSTSPSPKVRFFPVGTLPEVPIRAGAYYSTGLAGSATPNDLQTTTLEIQTLIKAYVEGNDIRVTGFTGVPSVLCPASNQTIGIDVINYDSTTIDFNDDTLYLTVSTNNPISQSFTAEVNSGTLAPGATLNVPVSNNFDFSSPGTYTLKVRADIDMEVDSNDNKRNYTIEVLPANPSVAMSVWPVANRCYGDTIAFIANPKTGGPKLYQWKLDGVNAGPPTTDSIFTPQNLLSTKVTVELITTDCNSNPDTVSSNEVIVTISPEPLSIAGKDTVIENTKALYFFSLRPNSTILWNVTGGIPDNTNTNRVNIDWGAAGTGIISVTETDQNSCSFVNEKEVTIVSIVGIEALEAKGFIIGDVYPNPATDLISLEISSPDREELAIKLYDVTGKKVAEVYNGSINGNKRITYDVSNLMSGSYYFEILLDGNRAIKKLNIR